MTVRSLSRAPFSWSFALLAMGCGSGSEAPSGDALAAVAHAQDMSPELGGSDAGLADGEVDQAPLPLDAAAIDGADAAGATADAAVSVSDAAGSASDAEIPPTPPEPPPPAYLRGLFDRLDASLNAGLGLSESNNERAGLAWGESYVMESYILMYARTRDADYLVRLATHVENVLAQRDSVRGVTDTRGLSLPCWQNRHYQDNDEPYCYAVHTGMITLPIIQFVRLLQLEPALSDVVAADGETLGQKAPRYLTAVANAVAVHDEEWRDGPGADEGYYLFRADAPAGVPRGNQPANQQNILGSVMFHLAAATADATVLDHARRLARLFKRSLGRRGEAYVWDYRNDLGDRAFDGPGEDISHAAINVQFAAMAAQAGEIFTPDEMAGFVATFRDLVVSGEGTVNDRVDGTGATGNFDLAVGRWLVLNAFDSLGAVFFGAQARLDEALDWDAGAATTLIDTAALAEAEPPLVLRAVNTTAGAASAWAGLAVARLGRPQLVAARNFDGQIYGYDFDAATGRLTAHALRAADGGAAWAGLAALDLDGDGVDEIAAARNLDRAVILFGLGDDGTLIERALDSGEAAEPGPFVGLARGLFDPQAPPMLVLARANALRVRAYDATGQGSAFAALDLGGAAEVSAVCAGDLDGDGLDEIVVADNALADLVVYRISEATLVEIARNTVFGNASQFAALACADLDGDGRAEVIANRNFDGATYILRLNADGALASDRRDVVFGATLRWGPLAAGVLPGLGGRPALFGASGRTAHLFAWSE